jgi:hypothetical protein
MVSETLICLWEHVNALPALRTSGRLQSASGEESSALMPSVLDRAFKGEL